MASIRWRGKKERNAQLCWYENGVEQRLSLGRITPSEAETRRKAKEVELDTGEPIFIASVRFTDHRTEYLNWHALEFPDSHFRVEQILTQCCATFEPKALSQIRRRDVEQWKAERMNRIGFNRKKEEARMSRGTAAKEFSTLRALFTKAVEWERLKKSPFDDVPEPKGLNSAPPHWYRKHELAQLYAREPYGDVWKLKANAGLRRAEILQLRPEDVDRAAKVLHVLSTEEDRTKSGKWRQVPLSDAALDALERLLAAYRGAGRVVPHVTGPSLSRAFARDVDALKLKGSLHSLRHSYGTHMIMAGVSVRALKDLMGHARIETTMIYLHVAEDLTHVQARAVSL
jgi:integrase/recombinase XerD